MRAWKLSNKVATVLLLTHWKCVEASCDGDKCHEELLFHCGAQVAATAVGGAATGAVAVILARGRVGDFLSDGIFAGVQAAAAGGTAGGGLAAEGLLPAAQASLGMTGGAEGPVVFAGATAGALAVVAVGAFRGWFSTLPPTSEHPLPSTSIAPPHASPPNQPTHSSGIATNHVPQPWSKELLPNFMPPNFTTWLNCWLANTSSNSTGSNGSHSSDYQPGCLAGARAGSDACWPDIRCSHSTESLPSPIETAIALTFIMRVLLLCVGALAMAMDIAQDIAVSYLVLLAYGSSLIFARLTDIALICVVWLASMSCMQRVITLVDAHQAQMQGTGRRAWPPEDFAYRAMI